MNSQVNGSYSITRSQVCGGLGSRLTSVQTGRFLGQGRRVGAVGALAAFLMPITEWATGTPMTTDALVFLVVGVLLLASVWSDCAPDGCHASCGLIRGRAGGMTPDCDVEHLRPTLNPQRSTLNAQRSTLNAQRSKSARAAAPARQNVVRGPSSCSTFLSGLKTNSDDPLPPQRIPSNLTLVPLMTRNTGEPLSPEPTPALTNV